MANEDTALREVDQELAEERQWAMFKKFGPAVIGAAIAIVVGVGGWQFWDAQRDNTAKQQALEFQNALELLEEDAVDGRAALKAISDEGSSGYSILASMHRAASFSRGGERLAAIQAYREIYNNGATPKSIRDLARLRAAYQSLNDGRDSVMEDLGNLAQDGGAYAYHAQEVSALAALQAEDYETAVSIFRQLSIDFAAPPAIRERAENFAALASSGKAGVNITGETQIDDLLSAVGAGVDGAIDIDGDHEGHGHANVESSELSETEEAPVQPDGGETATQTPPGSVNEGDASPENSENE